MKILLSVFACSPTSGSEGGVGWKYACALAANHDVWILTDDSRRPELELSKHLFPSRMHVVYYRPNWLTKLPMNSATAYLIFHFWMASVWRLGAELDAEHDFDLCWQLTYGTFRAPSSLWRVGKPLVIGPVGGGETAPVALFEGMEIRSRFKEFVRLAVIRTASWVPGFKACYQNADLVIARTPDTRRALPNWVWDKCHVEQEIGGWPQPKIQRVSHEGLNVLFAGRLLAWKGMHLGLVAFASFLARGGEGRLTIVGDGPQAGELRAQALQLGLDESRVIFITRIPQIELFELYRQQDVLLFPSLHDSGGNVVIEAMSFGLAVVCLDLGGPKCFVSPECGYVIPTNQRSRQQVELSMADALLDLYQHPRRLKEISVAARHRASEMSYDNQIERVTALAFSVLTQPGESYA